MQSAACTRWSVHPRLFDVVSCLNELVTSNFKGVQSEQLMKLLTKLFKVLMTATSAVRAFVAYDPTLAGYFSFSEPKTFLGTNFEGACTVCYVTIWNDQQSRCCSLAKLAAAKLSPAVSDYLSHLLTTANVCCYCCCVRMNWHVFIHMVWFVGRCCS